MSEFITQKISPIRGGGMIWFTADLHLQHENIIKFCNRPFSNVKEMDEKLINNWNEVVDKKDIIYILGDFSFGNPPEYASRLKGNKIFIKGSHDNNLDAPYMKIIKPKELKDEYGNQRTIVLCHYAMRSWYLSHYASWHLYAHHHGKLESYGLSMDIGVDCNNFYPFSLDDISKKMATLEPIVDFRKK